MRCGVPSCLGVRGDVRMGVCDACRGVPVPAAAGRMHVPHFEDPIDGPDLYFFPDHKELDRD